MAIIPPKDYQTLQTLFNQELHNDVTIIHFTQQETALSTPAHECASCKETRELLEELTSISQKLHLTVKDFIRDEPEAQRLGITHIPTSILQGTAKGTVRFIGIPAGYEFSTLIEDILDISRGTTKLTEQTRNTLSQVNQDLRVQVFVTPT